MLVAHVSDTHSTFPTIPQEAEIIVHSGDLLPNKTRGIREVEERYQTEWVINNLSLFKEWIKNKRFFFSAGNHDYIDLCKILRKENILATDITNCIHEYKGIKFYGFPYIPWIDGEWNYECRSQEMQEKVKKLRSTLYKGVDVLVCHCPPYGILDSNFVIRDYAEDSLETLFIPDWAEHIGNIHLTNLISYDIEDLPKDLWPKYLFCGHCHEHWGYDDLYGIKVSNAATKVNLIEI